MTDPRSYSKRQKWRRAVIARDGYTCRMPVCLYPSRTIDRRLRHPNPASIDVDHNPELNQLLKRGLDPFDPKYGRTAHARCNRSAGAANENRRRGQRRAAAKAAGLIPPRPKPKARKRKPGLNTSRPW